MRTRDAFEQRANILTFIVQFKSENAGIAPTITEMSEATGQPHSTLYYHLGVLEEEGWLRIVKENSARCLVLVGEKWQPPERIHERINRYAREG